MINNRQNGRRRGRGGGGPRPNNVPSSGNRQDNRQRGNAAQLHEKFKALARDMQLAGDRVQTEYYLQFADHYFRVLNENRARFEEQRPRRDDFMSDDEDDGDDGVYAEDGGDDQSERQQPQPRERDFRPRREFRDDRGDREPRGDRDVRADREPRAAREPREYREQRADEGERVERSEGPRRQRRPERSLENVGAAPAAPLLVDPQVDSNGESRLSLDVLPPAIASDGEVKPRRRVRRPRPEGEADIAPAA